VRRLSAAVVLALDSRWCKALPGSSRSGGWPWWPETPAADAVSVVTRCPVNCSIRRAQLGWAMDSGRERAALLPIGILAVSEVVEAYAGCR
jgi:hypothetical protein